MSDLISAVATLSKFRGESLPSRIASIESSCAACSSQQLRQKLHAEEIGELLLSAAILVKNHSSQINEIVHAAGILIALPKILEPGEVVESLSLGAGNSGKNFDLSTNRRVAEFTFIQWRGGSEVIRQNKIFKDFYFLSEERSARRKELYTIGTAEPLKFFNSTRALPPILSGNRKLGSAFRDKYGTRFERVQDFYRFAKKRVALCDVSNFIPLFAQQ